MYPYIPKDSTNPFSLLPKVFELKDSLWENAQLSDSEAQEGAACVRHTAAEAGAPAVAGRPRLTVETAVAAGKLCTGSKL